MSIWNAIITLSFGMVSPELFIKCEFNFVFLPCLALFIFLFFFGVWYERPAIVSWWHKTTSLWEIFSSYWWIPHWLFSLYGKFHSTRLVFIQYKMYCSSHSSSPNTMKCTWEEYTRRKKKTNHKKHQKYLFIVCLVLFWSSTPKQNATKNKMTVYRN